MDLISKYDLIEKIVQTDNEQVLQQVKNLLEEEGAPSWEDLDPALKASLHRGIVQSDKKQGIPHAKAMADFKKKYLKK
jgi:hypothetical protein